MSMFSTQNRITGLSGFDTETMVNQLMKAESMKYDKLYQQRELLRYKKESYQGITQGMLDFQSKFLSFTSNASSNIRSVTNWQAASSKITTGGTASSAITVKASSTTSPGNYTVKVSQIAQGDIIKSATGYSQSVTGEKAVDWSNVKEGDTFRVALDGGAYKDVKITADMAAYTDKADFIKDLNSQLTTLFGKDPAGTANAGNAKATASLDNGRLVITAGTGHTAAVTAGVKSDAKVVIPNIATTAQKIDWEAMKTDAVDNNGGKVNFNIGGIAVEADISSVTDANSFANTLQKAYTDAFNKSNEDNGTTFKNMVSFASDGTDVYVGMSGAESDADLRAFTGLTMANGTNSGSLLSDLVSFDVTDIDGTKYTLTANVGAAIDQKGVAEALNAAVSAFKDAALNIEFGTDPDGNLAAANYNSKAGVTVDFGAGKSTSLAAASSLEPFGMEVAKKSTGLNLKAAIDTVPGINLDGQTAFSFKINGKQIEFDTTASLSDIMDKINKSGAGVKVSFEEGSQQFTLESTSTGALSAISFSDDSTGGGFLRNVFGFVDGSDNVNAASRVQTAQDAIISVNGQAVTSREMNSFTIDGLTIGLTKDAAGKTFDVEVVRDNTSVLNMVKSFKDDYNNLVIALNKAYNQTRTTYNTYSFYDPLTEAQKKEMSESEVTKWEAEAKTGMLFRDQTVGGIINSMRNMVYDSVTLSDGSKLSLYQLGITIDESGTTSNNKVGTLKIDEDKFNKFLAENPDKVAEFFTKSSDVLQGSKKQGAEKQRYNENGFAERLNDIIWQATNSTTGTLYGIAGLPDTLKSTAMSKLIATQDTKMADMMKYLQRAENNYYNQFSKMEQAINQANQQMSSILGMLGLSQ